MSDRTKSTAPPVIEVPPELQGRRDRESLADAGLRRTFRVQLDPGVAAVLDRAVETATEADTPGADFPTMMEAAADDLAGVAEWLDYWADNGGDEIARHEVRLSAAVLDAVPMLARAAVVLREHVRQARAGAPASAAGGELPEPPECAPERDRPAVREIFAVQLRRSERETLERLADNLLELSREGSKAVRADIAYTSFPDDIRAVAADLRHAERFLRIVGASEGDALDRRESRLADLAAQLAAPIGAVAGQLEAAVAANPAE